MYVYVCIGMTECGVMHMSASAFTIRNRVLGPLKLEIQKFVSCLL